MRRLELKDIIPHSQHQRLQFIESVVYWEGGVQRQRVSEAFDVSPNHITRDFRFYRERYPENIVYDISERIYRAGKKFKPQLISGKPEEYLAMLSASARCKTFPFLPACDIQSHPVSSLPEPWKELSPGTLRSVIRALSTGLGLRITYLSMHTAATGKRIIWPHTLVNTGSRWHLRAYDDRHKNFRDFVLMRITEGAELVDKRSPAQAAEDLDWHATETVEVIPNPDLPEFQQRVVAYDYGMKLLDDCYSWREEIRRCLIPYFLHRHRLDLVGQNSIPLRIALRDKTQAERYAFSKIE